MPAASILILSYNQAQFLAGAVASALGQTENHVEVIVVDNGSTDRSREVLEELSDPRLTVVSHSEHAWPGVRMNEAVRQATSEYVCFLYSDDRYLPAKVERELAEFTRRGPDYGVVYGRAIRRNALTGAEVVASSVGASGDVFEALMTRGLADGELDMISPLIRRDLLVEHPFREDIFFESEAIFHRLALHTRFAFIPEPLVVALDHQANGGKALRSHREISRACLAGLRRDSKMTPARLRLVHAYEADLMRYYGWQGARLNAPRSWTIDCYRTAVRLDPRTLLRSKTVTGVAVALMPLWFRQRVNRAGHRLRGNRLNPTLVGEYPTLVNETDSSV